MYYILLELSYVAMATDVISMNSILETKAARKNNNSSTKDERFIFAYRKSISSK